jgi:hypothetical protein
MGFNAHSLRPEGVFVTTPNAYDGGSWMSGSGPAVDTLGNIFVPTGNGYFDVNVGGIDYGDSILRLSWAGVWPAVKDYFTPWDQAMLNNGDTYLASGGILLLPDQLGAPYPHLLVQVGKEGTIDLVNRDDMGHFNPGGDTQIVQTLPEIIPYGVWGAPAMWNNNLYIGGQLAPLEAFTTIPWRSRFRRSTLLQPLKPLTFPGLLQPFSASGNSNGIVWSIQSDAFGNGGNAVLRAYDATNLANELYNSNQNAERDQAGPAVKFAVPTIADGIVFVGTQNEVDVYGLLQ